MEDNGFNYDSSGLKVYDSEKFLNMFYSDELGKNKEVYSKLREFAKKQKGKIASELTNEEYIELINLSIVKSIKDFKEEKGASFQSFFYFKLRGEVKSFRSKRDATQKKINKLVNTNEKENVEYAYQYNKETEENTFEEIDFSDVAEEIIKEDKAKRQIKAFRMAFSGIPKELQFVLYQIGEGKTISDIAETMNLTEEDVFFKKVSGLSLLLQRVLRSRHLSEDDKEEVAELNNIVYEPFEFEPTINKEY